MENKTLIAMKYAIQIENLLSELDAEGMGLHEKVTFLKTILDKKTKKNIRFIASIRNQVMHENFIMNQKTLDEFETKSKEVIEDLNYKLNKNSKKQSYCDVTNDNVNNEDDIKDRYQDIEKENGAETSQFRAVPSRLNQVKEIATEIGKVAFLAGSVLIMNEF